MSPGCSTLVTSISALDRSLACEACRSGWNGQQDERGEDGDRGAPDHWFVVEFVEPEDGDSYAEGEDGNPGDGAERVEAMAGHFSPQTLRRPGEVSVR